MSLSTKAQKAKEKGNAAFKAGNFPEAVGHYTEAMVADGSDPTFPLNRAAAYLKLGKHVDAERDCTTVLRLSPGHVKALYRRAQSRIELHNLNEAKIDLLEALKREPGNSAVEGELQRVDNLLSKPSTARTAPLDVNQNAHPQRRRIPIEIVEADSSPLSSARSTDLLTPVSSRQLHPKPEDALPTPLPSPSQAPSRTLDPAPKATKSQSPAKPTSTRGGIFRASGKHTLFRTPEPSSPSPKSTTLPPKPTTITKEDVVLQPAPLSLFEFSRAWELASPTERWDLLCKIPPPSLPTLFKTSLEAPLLVQILEVCSLAVDSTGDSTIKARVREYLHWFQRVPRFSTVVLFLSKKEKELGRSLADAIAFPDWKM
ncbi:TPR-like protein [Fomitiporia mediterranea MF3/22]|uniref:TPR-like protein n=1 Tax=Fomitiporia mediterranea (strain MF3/22) TaxID=694068 RepID=UPI0004408457|nr:TPR-like protein [Fomitiporia mediterranea MF3/22]EJC98017.1 TPR-like protein [Fomitiporia mediterranea MF3/22]